MGALLAILTLGFALGMRHATDADHVVAVTTVVSRERSVRTAGLIGAAWGVGHTLTVLLVGGAIILFNVVIPPRLGLAMELAVALMLIALGAINLLAAERGAHAHSHSPSRANGLVRSLMVGVVHGLAGSAAVALLVLTTIRDSKAALLYLLLFCGGTIAGMALLTSIVAVPFAVAAERFAKINARMMQLTSLASIGFGVFLAYKIGIADGLFASVPHWTPQ